MIENGKNYTEALADVAKGNETVGNKHITRSEYSSRVSNRSIARSLISDNESYEVDFGN